MDTKKFRSDKIQHNQLCTVERFQRIALWYAIFIIVYISQASENRGTCRDALFLSLEARIAIAEEFCLKNIK